MKNVLFIILIFCTHFQSLAQDTQIVIAHTSDTHSRIVPIATAPNDAPEESKGGFARRAAMLHRLRKENPQNLLLFDCGDFSQGSIYYNLFKGEVEIKLMNAMGYDAALIGNHEFDFGTENLAGLVRMANFPFVCSNYDFSGTPLEGLVKPYIIIERAGVRVGIVGVSPKLEGLVGRKYYGNVKYRNPQKAVQPIINLLRKKKHCDLIVCLSHLGYFEQNGGDSDFIAKTEGIDIVLGGHTHTEFATPKYLTNKKREKVLLNHIGRDGKWVGTLTIETTKKHNAQ